MLRRRLLGLAAVATLAMAAGCSSSSNSSGATSSTPSVVETPATSGPATTTPTSGDTITSAGAASSSAPAPTTAPATTATAPSVPPTADLARASIRVTTIATLQEPIDLTTRAGDDGTLYVAERAGVVVALPAAGGSPRTVLDQRDLVLAGGERGLLGITFSPDGTLLYVHYSDKRGDTTVDELRLRADGTADPSSRRNLLKQQQPYSNHNGGRLTFGPDGYLYLGLGDGGSQNDPKRHGLDLGTWLGKILRVAPQPNGATPYAVPPDNPFVGRSGAQPEIWSYGLRNPWRFSFDALTGDLWIGDVGQNTIEEVDLSTRAEGAGKGVNWGWSALEGTRRQNRDQPTSGAVGPVYEYTHETGCSITGGFVYRGRNVPSLQGVYVFADYCQPGIRGLTVVGGKATARDLTKEPSSIVSFGEGPGRELYVLAFDGTVGRIDQA